MALIKVMADPSPWPSVISAALTGLLTGGALLIQTGMTSKRDEKRLRAEADEKDKDRRRAAEDRQSDNLFKARSEWLAAFHSYYLQIRHGMHLTKRDGLTLEKAMEHGNVQRQAGELLLQKASNLQLTEKDPVNRRLIKTFTMFIGMDRNRSDPKEDENFQSLFMAFLKFEDVLAGIDADVSEVLKRLIPVARTLNVSLEELTAHVRAAQDVPHKLPT